jgi:hypothetical protein
MPGSAPWWAVTAAVRQGGRGKPQPWRAGAAAVRAMERFIACYGIPEQVQAYYRMECTNLYGMRRPVLIPRYRCIFQTVPQEAARLRGAS